MKCIICEKVADEIGSHYVPASLIKKCVGKRNYEESYEIDIEKGQTSIYYGRNNLKNSSEEIKENHYTKDNILCKVCEKKLGEIEGKFSTEFLAKYREHKFISNFKSYTLETNLEILEPLKISNILILTYFYSIIYRYCKVNAIFDDISILTEQEFEKIKIFIYNSLYNIIDYKSIENYNLIITFSKADTNWSTVSSSTDFKNPYIFIFCEAIVQLFTEDLNNTSKHLFKDCLNNLKNSYSKIIIGPSSFFDDLSERMTRKLAKEYFESVVNGFCEMNGKTYQENHIELNVLIAHYSKKEEKYPFLIAVEEMNRKYHR